MAQSAPSVVRVLVAGDHGGDASELVSLSSKVSKAHAKSGPFHALLLLGFGGASGELPQLPVPAFFADADGGDGKGKGGRPEEVSAGWWRVPVGRTGAGRCELPGGVRVAFASDALPEDERDALSGGVDVLVTASWPAGAARHLAGDAAEAAMAAGEGSAAAARAAVLSEPHYHFSGAPRFFFERPPHASAPGAHATRLIAVAPLPAAERDPALPKARRKSLYAFAFRPGGGTAAGTAAAAGANPYTTPAARAAPVQEDEPAAKRARVAPAFDEDALSRPGFDRWKMGLAPMRAPPASYRCHRCGRAGHWVQHCANTPAAAAAVAGAPLERQQQQQQQHSHRGARPVLAPPGPCWFCLASPDVESHLIVSIGDDSYVAMDKGPLLPGHALILPIEHATDSTALPSAARAEMERYKDALAAMYGAQGLCAVFVERNVPPTRGAAMHMHVQALPAPRDALPRLREAFQAEGAERGIAFTPLAAGKVPADAVARAGDPFVHVEMGVRGLGPHAAGDGCAIIACLAGTRPRGALTFPREVLARALGVPDRADWKRCRLPSREEEEAAVQRIKAPFRPFDFTLGEK